MYTKNIFLFLPILILLTRGEISLEKKDKLLNGFIEFYNNLPNQVYTCEEGSLQNVEDLDDKCYRIEVSLHVSDTHNLDSRKYVKCTARMQELQDEGVKVANDEHHCQDMEQKPVVEEVIVTEAALVRKPVQLDNEVEPNSGVTSGEQFIAVPREEPGAPCIGCATHINPQAAGVTELATLAVRHLDRHDPGVRHALKTVIDVERQVQVVNGVRYILTLLVDYDSCTETQTESCVSSNTCKISILEKPWVKLPRGGKYRGILSNNCTSEWQFGDNGEVIDDDDSNNRENNEVGIHPRNDNNAGDDVITVAHTEDVQAQQNQVKKLTDDQVKKIEEQIIPYSEFHQPGTTEKVHTVEQSEEHAIKDSETTKYNNQNTMSQPNQNVHTSLSDERRKTIEELMNFFEFSAFGSERDNEKDTRMKRSLDHDVEAMLLADDFQALHKSIKNGRYLYDLAQTMVDYLNEMDLTVKTRTLKDVVKAEDEIVNYQHFYYIQARIFIPCDKAVCESKDTVKKICNGIIEGTDKKHPHVLTAFCYNEEEGNELNNVSNIPLDDPVLLQLCKESIKKIEKESPKLNALNISEMISATTQKVSGTLTKIAFILEHLNCTKDTPVGLRRKCKVVDELGSNLCEVVIFEKHARKERQITYNCIERPIDTSYSDQVPKEKNYNDDTKVIEMVQEALQYLEIQSNRNNKQKIVSINSVATQINAGLVTKIEFIVGYTSCSSNTEVDLSICPLLASEPLRKCNAQIWDRTWIEDGRQVEVDCDDVFNIDKNIVTKDRKKRSVPGGKTSQNPNAPEFKQLAEESMQKYLQSIGSTKPHKVVRVVKASTQVVSGSMTRIEFVISPSDGNSGDVISCYSEVWEQPWINKKEITVDCKINNQKYRAKRETPVGGIQAQDPNDPKFQSLAEESMQKYLQSIGSTKPHKVVRVVKASTQVVAGSMTRIEFVISPSDGNSGDVISCYSEVWEQPWMNKKEITVDCKINNQKYRAKRETPVGGIQAQDPNDPEFQSLAEESMQKYLQSIGSTKPHKVVRVVKASTQVVSGSMTRIEFVISPSDGNSGDVISCYSEVWEQPWMNKKEITVDCKINNQKYRAKRAQPLMYRKVGKVNYETENQESRTKREILGNRDARQNSDKTIVGAFREEQDPTKNQYKLLAKDSLREYQRLKKSKHAHKVIEVKRVRTKVVSGLIYEIHFTAVPTTCPSKIFDASYCKQQRGSAMLSCHSKIWNQPWLKRKQITVACNPDITLGDNRNKRDVDFGNEMLENEIEVDLKDKREVLDEEEPIDDELKYYYAERAIQHVNQASNTNNLDKLISVHAVDSSVHMGANMVRLYIEIAPTFCLKHADEENLPHCEEMDGMAHRLCIARLWPSPDDELVVQTVSVVCDDDKEFSSVSGLSIPELLRTSIKELEKSPDQKYKLVHLGEPQVIPSLDSNIPVKIEFIVGFTNCTKDVDIDKRPFVCYLDSTKSSKPCTSFIWFVPNSREIYQIDVKCTTPGTRRKRSVSMNLVNATADDMEIQKLVQESLEKLEMSSIHRYKQRVILINSYSTKLTSGKVTTIDFDVGYTSCLKYEWVDDITTCDFLEHLPRRHCVAHVFERLWLQNGKNIEVNCEDDETPLEAHIEFESAEMAMQLAKEALKHIEAKYPHPRKQKVVRIFSLEKQVVAGIHYRLKIEIGLTDCSALSAQTDCKLVKDEGLNKFCRVNVWLRPWTDHPANYRVTCDYHEAATAEVYHHLQAEHLFYEFLSTYKPEYIDDRHQMRQRFEIFKENVRKMHELNTHERGTATYGVTRFADLTYEEFSTKHMGMKASLRDPNQVQFRKAVIPNVTAPDSFDWRDHGAVTGVKDQGSCGSCWAFSVTGNIEGQWKMKTGDLVSLSEQELVDCDKLDQGCNGGLPDNAYRAIEQLGGLESEDDYPYEGSDDKCSFNKTLARVQISGAVNITSNETDMAKWLVKHGPISIGINANAMQFYMGGISHPWRMLCNPSNLDHGVLIVGYGAKDYPLFHKHLPYWIIKNSWGTSWGEQGYYRVYRGDGTCGVNQMASSAVV
ncbi:hypothetical protein O3G_MSEX012250 [Manduca sexta]|uniref:Cysteine proteinase n=1 Tax=Manduca sexta TaxID=7130 RepID=A0A921ZQ64_MANSE|nr:hypothetical protein O3G_MSEX012250 [Manduca sexta]